MSLDSYLSYKRSGISWYQDIPEAWDVQPLYALAHECSASNKGMIENNLLSLSYGNVINKDINSNDGLLPESFETYQVVEQDDIVLRLTDLQNDKRSLRSAIVKERGIITSAYLAIRPKKIDATFLNYLLRAYDLTKVFYSMGGGLRQSMKFSDVKRLPLILPSPSEQKSIVTFLNHETAKINILVAEQRKLIELMKEKRQAVISKAVTKGLNTKARMKDSGLEWLGEVPDHWSVERIRRFVKLNPSKSELGILDKTTEVSFLPMEAIGEEGTLSLEKTKPLSEVETGYTYFREGDVTVAKITPCFENGKGAVMKGLHNGFGFGTTELIVARPTEGKVIANFLYRLFSSSHFRKNAEGSMYGAGGQKRVPDDFIREFQTGLPPINEQIEIAEFLDYETVMFESLIKEATSVITLLNERRSALITAAVTGQIDVRNYQPKEVA